MSFDAAYLDLMKSSLTVKATTATSFYGVPSLSSGTTIRGHILYDTKIIQTNDQNLVTANAHFECPPPGYVLPTGIGSGNTVPALAEGNTVTFPDGRVRQVLLVEIDFDEDGTAHHQEVAVD